MPSPFRSNPIAAFALAAVLLFGHLQAVSASPQTMPSHQGRKSSLLASSDRPLAIAGLNETTSDTQSPPSFLGASRMATFFPVVSLSIAVLATHALRRRQMAQVARRRDRQS